MGIKKTAPLPGGRRLHLSIGNLLTEPVDAIVNAANSHLLHGGGVAAAIARAAGPQLDEESRAYVQANGPVPTGSAGVTPAGNLPYKGVIHAVGPVMGCGSEAQKLSSAVAAALRCAHRQGWKSIALPAISSGIYRVPLEICARSYVQGVLGHLEEQPDSSLEEIRITIFEGPLVELLEKEMDGLG